MSQRNSIRPIAAIEHTDAHRKLDGHGNDRRKQDKARERGIKSDGTESDNQEDKSNDRKDDEKPRNNRNTCGSLWDG